MSVAGMEKENTANNVLSRNDKLHESHGLIAWFVM